MLQALRDALRLPDLRRRLFYTLLILVLYRLASHVPVPGINHAALQSDRIVALRGGSVVFCGRPDEVMNPGVLERVYSTSFLLVDHPCATLPMIVPRARPERQS
jgi:ABC-type hemin transport system ATPase subunit